MKHLARGARVIGMAVLVSAGLLAAAEAAAAETREAAAVETRIKAAFIHHFCNYINWPEEAFEQPDSPLVLGVVGSGAMADALREVVDKRRAHGRPMTVRRLDANDSLEGVHLLFIAEAVRNGIRERLAAAADRSVLVITEGTDGLESGSAINFIVEDDRVRFDIAPAITARANLDVSAQLLTVARVIRRDAD